MDGTAASLVDLGWFRLVLLFSSCVTVGTESPSLSLCCYVYKMEEITLPAPIETTRGQAPTACSHLCFCHVYPRLALDSNPPSSASCVLDARSVPPSMSVPLASYRTSVLFLLCCECVQRKSPTTPVSSPDLCRRLQKWGLYQTKHESLTDCFGDNGL